MKTILFSPIICIIMIILVIKSMILFIKIQEHNTYVKISSDSSVLIDYAYANNNNEPNTHSSTIKSQSNTIGNNVINKDESTQPASNQIEIDKANTEPNKNNITDTTTNIVNHDLSYSEIELLKELSKRREKLDNTEHNIMIKEQVLKATEHKVNQKIEELKALQIELEKLLKQHDQKEHEKIISLVKIYENMKPKDAAKILNELEMPILLQVVTNMKEIKIAPIIASMDPTKAREISTEIAKQKFIDNNNK